jgi:hypothetical protein
MNFSSMRRRSRSSQPNAEPSNNVFDVDYHYL